MLDHLVYAVSDLEKAMHLFKEQFGVQPVIGGKHRGFGTHNALIGLGPKLYLELISLDPSCSTQISGREDPLGVTRTDLPRLTAWAAREEFLEEKITHANALGCPFVGPLEFVRDTPDGKILKWYLAFSEYTGTGHELLPFLINWGSTPHPADRLGTQCQLIEFYAEYPEPSKIELLLSDLQLQLKVKKGDMPKLVARISTPKGLLTLS